MAVHNLGLGRCHVFCRDGCCLVLADRGLYVSYHLSTGTQHNRGAVGLWIEEGNFVLYLVSRTTCGIGLSLGRIFFSSVRFSGLALDKRLRISLEISN